MKWNKKIIRSLTKLPVFGIRVFWPILIKKEGGQQESITLRLLYSEKYNTNVELYSYGGCFNEEFNVGGHVNIGRYCSFAKNVHYYGANHPIKHATTSPYFYNKSFGFEVKDVERSSLTVGNDVWIGANVIITSRCKHIGNGVVVGGGSVVTKDIPNYAIVVGSPAKIIGYRFSDEVIKRLEKSEWWSLSPNQLIKFYEYIDNPIEFANEILQYKNRLCEDKKE